MTFKGIEWANEVEKLKEFCSKGYSLQQIGNVYGLTRERIRQILNKYSIQNGIEARKEKKKRTRYLRTGDKEQEFYSVKRLKFSAKKANAKRNGIEFTLQFGHFEWPKYCPILGLEIDYFADGRQENSPSIDRIDSSKGYIPGNVHVISWRANRIKNDGTAEEHYKIAKYLSNMIV